jgi:hypothetical protein
VNRKLRSYCDAVTLKTSPLMRYALPSLALCALLMTAACSRSNNPAGSGAAGGATATASGGGSTSPAAKANICEVVTKADAEQVLGEPVKDPDGGTGGCDYEIAASGVGGRMVIFSIAIERDGKDAYEGYKKMSGVTDELMNSARDDAANDESQRKAERQADSKTQSLSGIGDKAYMSGGFHGGFMGSVTVSVLKGNTWILIRVIGTPKKGSEEALKAVAKKVTDAV